MSLTMFMISLNPLYPILEDSSTTNTISRTQPVTQGSVVPVYVIRVRFLEQQQICFSDVSIYMLVI